MPGSIFLHFTCVHEEPIMRWARGDGNVCTTEPLLMMGIGFRIVSLMVLVISQNLKTNGGAFALQGKVKYGWLTESFVPNTGLFMQLFVLLLFLFAVLTVGYISDY